MDAKWEFGLDGLPEESHKYRVNQDGEKLWEVMKWGAKNGNHIDWQWIFFKYNQDHWEEGQRLAEEYGINLYGENLEDAKKIEEVLLNNYKIDGVEFISHISTKYDFLISVE